MDNAAAPNAIDKAVAGLDAWFDTMRGPGGYGGPVAHWWQQSLLYTGPGLDWRYEGIIAGYVTLWQRSGETRWRDKAIRAANDLLSAQQADGHYPASAFEINPATAGTPHEAAVDAGLLLLAKSLRDKGEDGWQPFAACAERNIRLFAVAQLWDQAAQAFRDDPQRPSFVPNKAATLCEALFLLAEISGDDSWVTHYALPTLQKIVEHQVQGTGPLSGAIAQNSFGRQRIEKYFPIYIARCIPALLRGYYWATSEELLDAALRAMRFVAATLQPDGAMLTVVYPNLKHNSQPSWIAELGDVLRTADLLRPHGFAVDFSAVQQRLLNGQDSNGGVRTASGFAAQAGGRVPDLPDVRDVLHVAGWCDKAFRYLASVAGPTIPPAETTPFEIDCEFRGKRVTLRETPEMLEIRRKQDVVYCWRKGSLWAKTAQRDYWLR